MTNASEEWEQRLKQMQLDIAENKELIKKAQEPLKRLMEAAESN